MPRLELLYQVADQSLVVSNGFFWNGFGSLRPCAQSTRACHLYILWPLWLLSAFIAFILTGVRFHAVFSWGWVDDLQTFGHLCLFDKCLLMAFVHFNVGLPAWFCPSTLVLCYCLLVLALCPAVCPMSQLPLYTVFVFISSHIFQNLGLLSYWIWDPPGDCSISLNCVL